MRQAPVVLTFSGATTGDMTGNLASIGQKLDVIYAYSIQAVWTGGTSPVGTFKLQASDDNNESGAAASGSSQPTNWTDVTGSSQAISGTPGNIMYDVTQCSYRWVRLVYTASSGSATVSVMLNLKGS